MRSDTNISRGFILNNNGAEPIKNKIMFGENEQEIIKSLLSFSKNDENYIISIYNRSKIFLPDGIIPIAQTDCIDLICFDFRTNKDIPNIVYWNYEFSTLDEYEEDLISPICNNFGELVSSLE